MTCPACGASFSGKACPRCRTVVSGAVRTSAILIASGDTEAVFRSVDEVPDALRTRLAETTQGELSGTIVIADRAGREKLSEALRKLRTPEVRAVMPLWLLRTIGAALLSSAAGILWWVFKNS